MLKWEPPKPGAGAHEAPPARIGEYSILRLIGRGGMGKVFLARKDGEEREVALKVLHAETLADPELVKRFRREAKFMLSLDHPNIVRAFEVGTAGGCHFLSMEFVDGESLKDEILREKRLPPARALRVMREVALALEYGSKRGVVHRDLKPENVLIRGRDGAAKLADMGLAILAHRDDLRMTAPGMALGTPLYMSPEQGLAERNLDSRCDIYSLGCTFYHAICGQPPFEGKNPFVLIQQHVKTPPRRPSEIVPDLDRGTEAMLLKCLEKDRAKRFQTFGELVKAIDAALRGSAGEAPGPGSPGEAARSRPRLDPQSHIGGESAMPGSPAGGRRAERGAGETPGGAGGKILAALLVAIMAGAAVALVYALFKLGIIRK